MTRLEEAEMRVFNLDRAWKTAVDRKEYDIAKDICVSLRWAHEECKMHLQRITQENEWTR